MSAYTFFSETNITNIDETHNELSLTQRRISVDLEKVNKALAWLVLKNFRYRDLEVPRSSISVDPEKIRKAWAWLVRKSCGYKGIEVPHITSKTESRNQSKF